MLALIKDAKFFVIFFYKISKLEKLWRQVEKTLVCKVKIAKVSFILYYKVIYIYTITQ